MSISEINVIVYTKKNGRIVQRPGFQLYVTRFPVRICIPVLTLSESESEGVLVGMPKCIQVNPTLFQYLIILVRA